MLTSQSIRTLCGTHSATHPNEFFYCLVDHAGMPGLHRKLIDTNVEWISLFEGTKQANAISVAPLLFQIGLDPEDVGHGRLLTWVGERGTYTSSLTLLASPLRLLELSHRLAARLDAVISEGMEVLLRFYDPRVFEQLMTVLAADQKQSLLCVGSRWWYADRRGELQEVNAQFSDQDVSGLPLALCAKQEMALVEASEPDQVAEQLHRMVPNEFAFISQSDRFDFVFRQTATARRFGISSTYEIALYCMLALRYGSGFATTARWKSMFDDVTAKRVRLGDAIATATGTEEVST